MEKPELERASEIARKLEAFDVMFKALTHISEWNLAANPGHIDHRSRKQIVEEARLVLGSVESILRLVQ